MLPRFSSVRVLRRSCALNCIEQRSSHYNDRKWRSSSTASTEQAYLHNPGQSPLLETSVGQLLEDAARNWPNRECVVSLHQAQRLSFSELLRRADRLAAGFRKIGLNHGDRLGIWGPNQVEWLLSYMAAARAGLIAAGINPAYKASELEYSLRKIGAKAVVAPEAYRDMKYAETLLAAKKNVPTLEHIIIYSDNHVTGARRFADVEMLAERREVEAISHEQAQISPYSGTNIQFTSGTTGNSKATLLAHRSLVNNSRQAVSRLQMENRKACLNVPYFHAFGMVMGVVGPLHAGTTIVLENPTFNPVKSIEAILAEKCSVTFGTPTMWLSMIDVQMKTGAKIESLYTGCTGGAPASPDLYRRVREHLRMEWIMSIYGLTETTAIANQSLPKEPKELTETTIGYISDHTEIKVVNEKEEIVPFGTPGELCVRGYSTMIGYWGDEEATKKTFMKDGWLKTGDVYILRKDGYGHIVGRLKDMLIRGGENIFPREIEHFLESHPAIAEVHAFGAYDPVYGEELCACIRLRVGAHLTAEEIVNYSKERIARFKIPRYIVFREDFPKTTSGKIQKYKLKLELEDQGIIPKAPTS